MRKYSFIVLLSMQLFGTILNEVTTDQRICSWLSENPQRQHRSTRCKDMFQCLVDGRCIPRSSYCDGDYDCGGSHADMSDERYCNSYICPDPFVRCGSYPKCIPNEWICDGVNDCPGGVDEINCEGYFPEDKNVWHSIENVYDENVYISSDEDDYNEMERTTVQPHIHWKGVQTKTEISNIYPKILQWLENQKSQKMTQKWGTMVDRKAVIFFFANNLTLNAQDHDMNQLAYEVTIQLLSRLHSLGLEAIPSSDLASYLNAFLVMCLDPRKFYGLDIVSELRSRVDKQNYTNPYILLTLCNAGETITNEDKEKLTDAFRNKRRQFWTDVQALSVMALVCASKQPGNEVNTELLLEMTEELKQHQYRNGTVEDLLTTTLVLQALISADVKRDPDNFDETKALNEILKNQKADGSFGDVMKTYFAAPIFLCRSLIDISSSHCQYTSSKDEISALEDLATRSDPKIRVEYSLWIGNEKTLERNLAVRVPANMSLYGIMEIAAELDSTYQFEYVVQNRKPYINALSGLRDDPERGKFWFLYTFQDGQVTPCPKESPAEIIPRNDEHYVMWYRRGSWNEF